MSDITHVERKGQIGMVGAFDLPKRRSPALILDIERAWHKHPGWFDTLTPEQQEKLVAQHRENELVSPPGDRHGQAPNLLP